MKKQTAVDLLIDKIRSHISENGKLDAITISRFKMHAKAIEKQQMIDSYVKGCNNTYGIDEPNANPNYDRQEGEQCYNETFK